MVLFFHVTEIFAILRYLNLMDPVKALHSLQVRSAVRIPASEKSQLRDPLAFGAL